ncbi:hypothetical protein AV530_015173 [Patagioenas fasciata monilis]|uniref:Uncharacterized protein n=1 Tax=Patagioenas fasciata monilis TaxID=372326 RepID=A0A1V4K1G7_PATFA|nr:hypothetical protein AV530_015173 [Patagioenas fasciata monilis]
MLRSGGCHGHTQGVGGRRIGRKGVRDPFFSPTPQRKKPFEHRSTRRPVTHSSGFLASNTSDCHGQPINLEMSCTGALTMHEPCACRRRENNPDHAAGWSCGLETGQPSAKGFVKTIQPLEQNHARKVLHL